MDLKQILTLVGVFLLFFAVGAILLAVMVVLFIPAAFPYYMAYLWTAVAIGLVSGGSILVILGWTR